MAIRTTFRCGSSNAVYNAPPARPAKRTDGGYRPNRADTEPVRLRTRMHLAGGPAAAHAFRVIAWLDDGGTSLVCVGATRQEVVARARAHVAGAGVLHLQKWVGGLWTGRWQTLRPQRGELYAPRPRMGRRRRGFIVSRNDESLALARRLH
jgi:hypothetical protein